MIVCRKFVYIHTSRHAGTFINKLLLEHVPDTKMLRYHGQLSDLPAQYSELPVLGFVRNPWDWYVSMYFNYKKKKQYVFEIVSEQGSLGFEATIERFANLGDGSSTSTALLTELQRVAPERMGPHVPPGLRNPGLRKENFQNYPAGLGYYSWLVRQMHEVQGTLNGAFGRFEKLRSDLPELLRQTGTPITPEMSEYIEAKERLNSSSREDCYRRYFSESLADLVGQRDRYITERFDYTF